MDKLIHDFSVKSLADFFRNSIPSFVSKTEELEYVIKEKELKDFSKLIKIGSVEFKNTDELMVFACKYNSVLSQRSSRKKQFEIAKKVLKEDFKDGAIFVFYDEVGKFRFSFIQKNYGEKANKKYTSWKRFTYLVDPEQTNKTFKNRIGNCTFKDLESICEAFSVEKLTKEFYSDLFQWYQWALSEEVGITFPKDTEITEDDRSKLEEQIIRLITRLLFVWFIKQKNLVSQTLFDIEELSKVLKDFDPNSMQEGNYYNAILQNLFFATLNKAIGERDFARLKNTRDIKTLYRYAEMFSISEKKILELFKPIPFLNGGLFECLDKEDIAGNKYYLDGFSRNDKKSKGNFKHRAFIPNCVFFDKEKGIIPLLERYNFTVEENAPNEIQVALDPELLGNVFENLLGAFNEETKETARKQSGSFYTPREIVSYMVDESLIAYLTNAFPKLKEDIIRQLFEEEKLSKAFVDNHSLCQEISVKLRAIKILDPACGSGAFPMGILNRMVEVLEKLDSKNKETHYNLKLHLIEECIYGVDIQTIAVQISKLRFFISLIVEQEAMDLSKSEENYSVLTLPNLETKFVAANTLIGIGSENRNLLDFNDSTLIVMKNQLWRIRKQHFYAKKATDKKNLREQDEKQRERIKNYITENTANPNQELIIQYNGELEKFEAERKNYEGENWVETTGRATQTDIFGNHAKKGKSLFSIDKNRKERERIDKLIKAVQTKIDQEYNKIKRVGIEAEVDKLAKWDPYDQNSSSPFFDPEWMFGLEEGFDLVIGNPPYVQLQKENGKLAEMFQNCGYKTFTRKGDIYSLFYEKGWQLLKLKGVLCFITSNKWMRAGYGESTRKFFAENTNPILLIDFSGQKIFESATVDVNILMFAKDKNRQQTQACIVKEKLLNNLSDYFRQKANFVTFIDASSWVVLSPIEQQIKEKIEQAGTPLKDWNIQINYGIKTGFNEVFIINGDKRNEILDNCITPDERKKTDEIIRPILRGRDIKRYGYDFADLWLINTHNGIKEKGMKPVNINDYPAIKKHLDSFWKEIEKRADQGDTPYNLRNCAYMDDFSKQKIVWGNLNLKASYAIASEGFFVNAPCSMIVPSNKYLLGILNSKLADYYIRKLGVTRNGGYFEYKPMFIEQLPVPIISIEEQEQLISLVGNRMYVNQNNNLENDIDNLVYELYGLNEEEINFIENQ